MDRRSLLKSAAAVSAATILPPVAPTAAAEAATAATPVAPLSLRPYANYVWEWMVSHDGEVYYEGFATKEEAIEYAKQSEYSMVAECLKQDFSLDVDGWRIIEQLNDDNMGLIGEGEGIECTTEQEQDLAKMVTRAIEAWVVKHNINLTAWTFASTKNATNLVLSSATNTDDIGKT